MIFWFSGSRQKYTYVLPKRADDLLILKLKSRTEIENFLGGIKKLKKKKKRRAITFYFKKSFFPLKYMEKAAKKFVAVFAIILDPS